jgi:hypothetical protein
MGRSHFRPPFSGLAPRVSPSQKTNSNPDGWAHVRLPRVKLLIAGANEDRRGETRLVGAALCAHTLYATEVVR